MKDSTVQTKPEHNRLANAKRTSGPEAVAMAPPSYCVDFLDSQSPHTRFIEPHQNGILSANASRVDGIQAPNRHMHYNEALFGNFDYVQIHSDRHVANLEKATNAKAHTVGSGAAFRQGFFSSVLQPERVTADADNSKKDHTQSPPTAMLAPVSSGEQTLLNKHIPHIPSVRRGVASFLAGYKPLSGVNTPAHAEKPRFSLETHPAASKDAAVPARPAAAAGKAIPKMAAAPPKPATPPVQAEPVSEHPGIAGQSTTEAAPEQIQEIEALSDDKSQTPEQINTHDKLDVASPVSEPEAPAESAEPAEASHLKTVAEEVLPQPPEAAAGLFTTARDAMPTPPSGDDAVTPTAEAPHTAQVERLEQSAREQAAEQHAEEQAQERAESQPVAAQIASAPQDGEESVEFSQQEKSAALASVGEDAGGGEAPPGGSGSTGSAGSVAQTPEPEAPDTTAMEPEIGLGAAANLPVGAAVKALSGVGGAMDNFVHQEGERLQGEMPIVNVGSEASGSAVQPLPVGGNLGKTQRTPTTGSKAISAVKPLPPPPPSTLRSIPSPRISPASANTALSAADAQRIQSSIHALPTSDPGLDVPVSAAPTLSLSGDADPTQISDQNNQLQAGVAAQCVQGRAEVVAPAGENDICIRRPKEALQAPALVIPGSGGGGAAAAPEEAIAIIAEEKKGGEVRAAIRQAQSEVVVKKAEHQSKVTEEKNKTHQQLNELKTQNVLQQNEIRQLAKSEVDKARSDWSEEQRKEVAKADEKSRAELGKSTEKIAREQQQADQQAFHHIAEGEQQALRHRRDAESNAFAKKKEAETESQGMFGWIGAKVTTFFDQLKQGLTAIFEAAKNLIRIAIEQAKKLAFAVIEKARVAVVSIIRAVSDALIAIGDALFFVFPTLRAKWRAFIESKVKAAEDWINRLADNLKLGAQKLLDLLSKGMEFLLNAYKKAMLMVLNAAKAAALGAIKFAKSVADALGAFAALIKDIAQNPGAWIANLAAAVKDGIKNHLWKAFSGAVKGWFNDKIESIVGIGAMIWNILKKGGLAFKEVGVMIWEGLKAAIPTALIGILIEKLVAMIVPAAGAVMVVIEGVKAAWGSIQYIIAAAGKFVEFLKAVKGGGAGPQFAFMLSAAAIVVIDFVANWLLRKLRGPASKIGNKIKAIAKRILDKIKALAKRIGRWLKGKFKGVTAKVTGWLEKRKAKKGAKDKDKSHDKQQEKQERLNKAVEAIRPKVAKLVAKGVSRYRLEAQLLVWQTWYRLSALTLKRSGDNFILFAKVNPDYEQICGITFDKNRLVKFIMEVSQEVLADAKDEDVMLGQSIDKNKHSLTTVPPQATLAKVVSEEREKTPLPEKHVKRIRHEAGPGGETTEISQKQGKGNDIRNQIVSGTSGPGTAAKNAQPYLEQQENLKTNKKYKEGLAAQLQGEPGAADAIDSFFKPGRASNSMDAHKTAEIAGVLQQEAVRSNLAVAEIAMMIGTAKTQGKNANWKALLTAFPMQRKDARKIQETLEKQLTQNVDKDPKGSRVKKLRNDIFNQIKVWIETMQLVFDNEVHAKDIIRKMIRDFWAVKKKTER